VLVLHPDDLIEQLLQILLFAFDLLTYLLDGEALWRWS